MFSIKLFAQGDLAVFQTGMYVGNGTNLAVFGDVLIDSDSPIQNEGQIEVNAISHELTLTNFSTSEAITGTGMLRLQADNRMYIAGNQWLVSNLQKYGELELQLQTGIHIANLLDLQEGRIFGNGYTTSIQEGTGSLNFNYSEQNTAYIVGDLRLPMAYGDSTIFPLGDATHFHPITISNFLEENSWVQVNYLPSNIAANNPGVYFLSDNWWNFTLQNDNASGFINASVSSFNFGINNLDGNIYIAPIHSENEGITDDLPYFFIEELQQSNKDNSSYTLTGIENPGHLNIADIASLRIIMPNYLKLGEGYTNNFIIPNIDVIGDAELVIFSRLGNILYESDNYQNDFDFTDYPTGTYYYTISFEIQGESNTYQSFIEII